MIRSLSRYKVIPLVAVTVAMLCLSSCSADPTLAPTVTPTSPPPTTAPEPTLVPEVIQGLAQVETVEVLLMESWPLQASVQVRGMLPDGCTTIDEIRVDASGKGFDIAITTRRPSDMICTQALVPFEEIIPIDILGMVAGDYVVDVNGVQADLILQVDNVSIDETGATVKRTETLAGISMLIPEGWKSIEQDTWRSLDDLELQVTVLDTDDLDEAKTFVTEGKEVLSRMSPSLAWCDGVLYALEDRDSLERQYALIADADGKQFLLSLSTAEPELLESNLALFESIYSTAEILKSEDEFELGQAPVESVVIETTNTVPVEAVAVVTGYLADGCTEIDQVDVNYDAPTRTFHVSITTLRPRDTMCTEAIEPFEQRVPLQVYGLSAQKYTVEANGAKAEFELTRDNRAYLSAVPQEGKVSVRLPECSLLMLVPKEWEQVATGWVSEDGTVIGVQRHELDDGEILLDILPDADSIMAVSTPTLGWSGALCYQFEVDGQFEEHVLAALEDGTVLDIYQRAATAEQLEVTAEALLSVCQSVEIEV